jgi:UDPglucose--hexose-1-phosphate uridylyltransferase
MIELADGGKWPSPTSPERRFVAGKNTTSWQAVSVSDEVPSEWTVVVRDLWKEFGDMTLTGMEAREIRLLVDLWIDQYRELGSRDFINNVQIFENRGAMMGASNPHPHGQIWASSSVPDEVIKEQSAQSKYTKDNQSCLLCDYIALEYKKAERLVCDNEHFVVVVPFWAVWPFETLVIGKRHTAALDELDIEERDCLADILKMLTQRYDNLFNVPFPYSMGFHQRPTDGESHPEWHLHAHFYPPLLRSATVRKFMVGFELLGGPQRDITAEDAAQRLRKG